jgi:hypothetical protein
MEDNLNSLNETELQILLNLADNPDFHVLQKLHDLIIKEMKDLSFRVVPIKEEDRIQHAVQLGHYMAWERDKELKKIVKNFIELKSKKKKKK